MKEPETSKPLKKEYVEAGPCNNKGRPAGSGTTSHARKQRRAAAALEKVTGATANPWEKDQQWTWGETETSKPLKKEHVEAGPCNNKGRPAGSGTTSHARKQRRAAAALEKVTGATANPWEKDQQWAWGEPETSKPLKKEHAEAGRCNKGRPAGSGTTSHARKQRRAAAALEKVTGATANPWEKDQQWTWAEPETSKPLKKEHVEVGPCNNKGRPAGSGTTSHARKQRRAAAALEKVTGVRVGTP